MTRATICAQYFLQTIANSHSGNLMVDMTETMVERRISELELRYSAFALNSLPRVTSSRGQWKWPTSLEPRSKS